MDTARICHYLRTKTLYIPEQAGEAFAVAGTPKTSAQCWCNKTLTALGPDDRVAGPKACCDPLRPCYETR